jgi:hypothetical protein
MLRLSDRLRFSILTTVLTFAYTFYLYLSSNLLGHYWYVITAPLATFACSYFFGTALLNERSWMILILPLSAALTLISHCLNVLILCVYLALSGSFSSPPNDGDGIIGSIILTIYGSIMIMVYGSWISLYNGGLVSFIIFVLSGTLSKAMPARSKKKNLLEETLPLDDRKNRHVKSTTGNSG